MPYTTTEIAQRLSSLNDYEGCLPCALAHAEDEPPADDDTTSAPAAAWSGVIGFEGEVTGDGRMIAADALKWTLDTDHPSIPLRYVKADVGAHDGAVVVGRITRIWRDEDDPGKVMASGDFDANSDDGREAARQVAEGLTTGISMDLDDVNYEVRVAEELATAEAAEALGLEVQDALAAVDEDGRVTVAKGNADDEILVTTHARIRAATLVAVPAFAGAHIKLAAAADGDGEAGTDEFRDFTPEERREAHTVPGTDPGSFPIENCQDLQNAIKAIGRAKDRAATIKHIKAQKKRLGCPTVKLPDDWAVIVSATLAEGDEEVSAPQPGDEHWEKQLRVPKGNGLLSGRWVDMPWTWMVRFGHCVGRFPESQYPGKDFKQRLAQVQRLVEQVGKADITDEKLAQMAHAAKESAEALLASITAAGLEDSEFGKCVQGLVDYLDMLQNLDLTFLNEETDIGNEGQQIGGDDTGGIVPEEIPDGKGDSVVAAAPALLVVRDAPPAEFFSNPRLTKPTPLTVATDGRVFGHLAVWGTCHLSHTNQGRCITPPTSATNYAYFHTGAVQTADGTEVAVGHITLDTGHAGQALNPVATLAHYDDTGTAVADVRAGEDSHGIWVSGQLRPGVTPEQIAKLRSSPLSGDWRRVGTTLELVAALAVNVPGFPIPRPSGMVASGTMQSLVAAGMLAPPRVRRPGTPGAFSTEDLRYLKRLMQDAIVDERAERKQRAALAARLRDKIKKPLPLPGAAMAANATTERI